MRHALYFLSSQFLFSHLYLTNPTVFIVKLLYFCLLCASQNDNNGKAVPNKKNMRNNDGNNYDENSVINNAHEYDTDMIRRQSSDSGFSSIQGSDHSSYRPSRRGSMNLYDNEYDENDENDDENDDDDDNDDDKMKNKNVDVDEKEGSEDEDDEGNYSDDDFERLDSPAAGKTKDPNMFSKTVPLPKNVLSSAPFPVGKSLSEPLIKYSDPPIIIEKNDTKDEKLTQAEIDRRKSFELIKQRWLVSTVEITESKDSVAVALPVTVMSASEKEEDSEFTKGRGADETRDRGRDKDRSSGREDDKKNELVDRDRNDGPRESVNSEVSGNISDHSSNNNYKNDDENNYQNENDNYYGNNYDRGIERYNEVEKSNDREESMISRTKNDNDGDRVLDPGSSSRYNYSDSNSRQSNSFLSSSIEGRNSTLKTSSQSPSNSILHQNSDLRSTDIASRKAEGDGLIGIKLLTTIGSNSMVSSYPPPMSSNVVLTMSESYNSMPTTSSNIRNNDSIGPQRDADPRYSSGTYGIPPNEHSGDYDGNNNMNRRSVTFQSNQEASQLPLNAIPKGDYTSTHFSSITPLERESQSQSQSQSQSNLNRPPFSHIDPQPVHMFQPYNAYPVRSIVNAPLSVREIETSKHQIQDNFNQDRNRDNNIFLSIEDRMARDFKRDTTRQPSTILNQKQPPQVNPPGWPHELPMTVPSSKDLYAQLAMISSASDRRAALANVKAKAITKSKAILSTSTYINVPVSNSAVNRLEQGTARLSRQMDSLQKEISTLASQPSRGRKIAWNAPGVSADLGSSSKRGGEFAFTSNKNENLRFNSGRKEGPSYIPVTGGRKERDGDMEGDRDRGSRRDSNSYSPRKKEYIRNQDSVEIKSGREVEREGERGSGRGSERGTEGIRGTRNGRKGADGIFNQGGELVDGRGRNTSRSRSRSRSGSRSDNGSRMYSQHEKKGWDIRNRDRDGYSYKDYRSDDDNDDENYDKFDDNRDKNHYDNDDRDAVQKEEDSLAEEEDSLAEAYQESRWGLQAMETMQKIVESGTILNQRVRYVV